MADSKKYNGSQWEHSLRKLTTATADIEPTIYTDGTAITSYTISGNTVQNGTPTPTNPVEVNGVGERTAQLIPEIEQGGVSTTNGSLSNSMIRVRTNYVSVESGKTYSVNSGNLFLATGCYYLNGTFKGKIDEIVGLTKTGTFTVPDNVNQIAIGFKTANDSIITPSVIENYMLNLGSTAKPYEPYGYKIPISSGGVTTNIYLGSTQTVRRVKKLVLTGEENFGRQNISDAAPSFARFSKIFQFDSVTSSSAILYVSTHFTGLKSFGTSSSTAENCFEMRFANGTTTMMIVTNAATTATSFNQWLADQYANGTPVTVWYVLATPETAAVNEPLMKIGTYTDTLSNATSIPTTEGANSISIDTAVQTSEFTATWTGWHDASVKEWDGSDWQ